MKKMIAFCLCTVLLLCGCEKTAQTNSLQSSQDIVSQTSVAGESSLDTSSAAPSSTAVSSIPSVAKTSSAVASSTASPWWKTALKMDTTNSFITMQCVVNRDNDLISAYAGKQFSAKNQDDDYSQIFNSAAETKDIGKRIEDLSSYKIMISDDTGYTGEFYEKGVSFKSLDGKNSVLLSIKTSDYSTLLTRMRKCFESTLYSSLLNEINALNCSSVMVKSKDGVTAYTYTTESKDIPSILRYIAILPVVPDSMQKVSKTTELAGATSATINMNDGTVITVLTDGKTLLVSSSDREETVSYTAKTNSAESYVSTLESTAKGIPIHPCLKPVIYLYPEKPTEVSVKLAFKGQLTYTYPAYNNGWDVTAYPDGRLINKSDNCEHYYLFWEGVSRVNWDVSKGFVVAGKDTETFLKKALVELGLTPKEYNDFLVFWVPRMQDNPYNLITFSTTQYNELAPLEISPKPDSVLRVHMVYKALQKPVKVKEQKLTGFTRKGFTVVEWGGTEAN